jgi:hypothetical protein
MPIVGGQRSVISGREVSFHRRNPLPYRRLAYRVFFATHYRPLITDHRSPTTIPVSPYTDGLTRTTRAATLAGRR